MPKKLDLCENLANKIQLQLNFLDVFIGYDIKEFDRCFRYSNRFFVIHIIHLTLNSKMDYVNSQPSEIPQYIPTAFNSKL